METAAILKRVDELLAFQHGGDRQKLARLFAGALSVASTVYGDGSPQAELLKQHFDGTRASGTGSAAALADALGVLHALHDELQAGLLGDLRRQIAGGVLGDFVALAREALDERAAGSDNVAAVLAASAFEDLVRRLGDRAGVAGRPKLHVVLEGVRSAGLLQGAQVGIAQSYLKFRNDALHADWGGIDRTGTESLLGFVEQMLLKHFS
jgi:hypothetical protein